MYLIKRRVTTSYGSQVVNVPVGIATIAVTLAKVAESRDPDAGGARSGLTAAARQAVATAARAVWRPRYARTPRWAITTTRTITGRPGP